MLKKNKYLCQSKLENVNYLFLFEKQQLWVC